ncbi:tetratricopeptide repeat protein [Streptomyces sp. NPDC056628]|uniref:tetratricopeptide repeat protein n=1 Tax=Streptomyces sp. NPDC056628 TaxID=3345882 RepID=UPI0036758500
MSERQSVCVENGFAYGCVGADIHVFGDGLPVYVLENWRPAPDTDRAWLTELPSRMLNARYQTVDFTGRAQELASLHRWRDNGPRLSVRWLHGAGGQGKTRLAAQFAQITATGGWKVVVATHGPGSVLPPPGSQDLRLRYARGLLLVIDYADQWPLAHLTWLFSNALLHRTGTATRILLIARSTDAWPAVRAVLANHQAGTSALALSPLPGDDGTAQSARLEMFAAARDAFAALYDVPAAAVGPPGALEHRDFGLTLAVHMAALVAVDARANHRRPPTDVESLTIYLLDREHLHWARLYGDATHALSSAGRAYATPPEVMNQAVFAAVLTGPQSRPTGTAALESVRLQLRPERVLTDHALCYPPADRAQETVLEPLYPDRLAEDFLALTLPGHLAQYPAQPWADATATALLAPDGTHPTPPSWTGRTVVFLASAAQRWPHIGPRYLDPLLLGSPQLAIDAGSAALAELARVPGISRAALEAVEALFPPDQHVDLDPGIAHVAARLANERLATTEDPHLRAEILTRLAGRLRNAGRHDEALTATQGALPVLRDFRRPTSEYKSDLATLLLNLGTHLSDVGRWEEALTAAKRAVRVYRRLAKADPATHEPGLAKALLNLGGFLSAVGRREEALSTAKEAVAVLRRLANADRTAHEPRLAMALDNLSKCSWDVGRREEALSTAKEAVAVLRRLAKADPAAHEPGLANALSNLGTYLPGMGRWAEALSAAEEVVALRRRLAKANTVAFEPRLAESLSNFSASLSEVGRWAEALSAAEEAVALRRRLMKTNPAVHEAALAMALGNLAKFLSETGRPAEAVTAGEESVQVFQRLVEANPAAHEPNLALALSSLGKYLSDAGRPQEALAPGKEAVRLSRRLAKAHPVAHGPGLAMALTNLSMFLSMTLRPQEALTAAEEAVQAHRRLVEANPAAHEPGLAQALNNLGACLLGVGRQQEALSAAEEAVAVRRRLAKVNPGAYEPALANSLHRLCIFQSSVGRWEEALTVAEEAVPVFRRLAQANATHEFGLAQTLNNLCIFLSAAGRWQEALTAVEEAVRLFRRLAGTEPAAVAAYLQAAEATRAAVLERRGLF